MATNQVSEQEIQFRKRARRRLVGAVALVLLMVTVLPMVLDDREVKPTQQDIAITIPSQDGTSFSSRIVPVAPESASAVPETKLQLAPPLEPPAAQPDKAVAVPVKPVPSQPLPVAKPPQVQTYVKPAETPAPKVEAPKPAAVAKPVAKKGSFAVQVGVYTDTPKLKELESKLAAQGFRATRENVDTPKGAKIRLRTGPYATRAEAESVQAKLKAAGVVSMVVTNK